MTQTEVSMSNKRYPEEFKIEAVKQVTVAGHSVADVAERLGEIHDLAAVLYQVFNTSSSYWKNPINIRRNNRKLKN